MTADERQQTELVIDRKQIESNYKVLKETVLSIQRLRDISKQRADLTAKIGTQLYRLTNGDIQTVDADNLTLSAAST